MQSIEQEFARRFAEAWKQPSPERLVALLHPDVVLYQPHRPVIRGKAAALDDFQRVFRWLPGLHGEVDRFLGSQGVVFIEWRIIYPIGRKGVPIGAVDRFTLLDGLGIERVVYYNQLPLVIPILTHPRVCAGYLKYLLAHK